MQKDLFQGHRLPEVEIMDLFPASEGVIDQYYGRIGCGKTYAATCDALELLRRGKVVYCNWRIDYHGYDESKSIFRLIVSLVFPWIKRFYFFPKENLRYFEFSDKWAQNQGFKDWTDWFTNLTDCHIFADEGHLMFDSYNIRMPIEKRATILHTRHFNRSIHIISQRPTAVHVAMRANVNIFYKCEKIFQFGSIVRFKRTEYQDMINENVDEADEKEVGRRYYWGRQKIFNSYDTKYLRGGMKSSQKVSFQAYEYGYLARLSLLAKSILGNKVIHRLSTDVFKKGIIPKKMMVLHLDDKVVKYRPWAKVSTQWPRSVTGSLRPVGSAMVVDKDIEKVK